MRGDYKLISTIIFETWMTNILMKNSGGNFVIFGTLKKLFR